MNPIEHLSVEAFKRIFRDSMISEYYENQDEKWSGKKERFFRLGQKYRIDIF